MQHTIRVPYFSIAIVPYADRYLFMRSATIWLQYKCFWHDCFDCSAYLPIIPLIFKRLTREHWLKGSVTVWLTFCFFCLDSAALLMLNEQQIYLFGQIQTSQTGYQLYSDTSPYGECSLVRHFFILRATSTKGIFILPYLNIPNGLFTLTFSSDAHVSLEMTSCCMMQPTWCVNSFQDTNSCCKWKRSINLS